MSEQPSSSGFQSATPPAEQSQTSTPDGNNSSEPAKTQSQNTLEAKAQRVRDLLNQSRNADQGDPESSGQTPEGEGEATQGDVRLSPPDWGEVAEKLGMSETDLYKMEVNAGDGETVTLEALKDDWRDRSKLRRDATDKALDLERREAQLTSDIQALGILDAMGSLTPEVQQKANGQMIERYKQDLRRFTALVPELADDNTRLLFEEKQQKWLAKEGIARLLDPISVMDGTGQFRLFLRKAMRNEELLAEYRKAEKPKPPKAVAKSKGTQPAASKPATSGRGRMSAANQAKAQRVAEALRKI